MTTTITRETMTTTQDALQRAIDFLGAVLVQDADAETGATARYAVRPWTRGSWYTAGAEVLLRSAEYRETAEAVLRDREAGYEYTVSGNAYGSCGPGPMQHWRSVWGNRYESDLVELRAWWTPELPYAVRIEDGAQALHLIATRHATEHAARRSLEDALASDDWAEDCHSAEIVTVDYETGEEVPA
ncbi:MAG: hypothetical protein KGL39_37145 [Patescibacteria group bacterium]|nr:hypothetical protein [Patescibacteria group bacterium]